MGLAVWTSCALIFSVLPSGMVLARSELPPLGILFGCIFGAAGLGFAAIGIWAIHEVNAEAREISNLISDAIQRAIERSAA